MSNDYIKETEKYIIGGIIYFGLKDKYCEYALNNLTVEDFNVPQYRLSFEYLKGLYLKNDSVDAVDFLRYTGISSEVFADLISCCSTVANFKSYVKILKQHTSDIRIMRGLASIQKFDDKFSQLEKLYQTEKEYQTNLSSNAENRDRQQYIEFLNYINTPIKQGDRIYTGFPSIDACTGGFRKKSISIVGAYPSTGKTTLALNIARNQIKVKNKTVFFSLEMSCNQIYERLIADILSINYYKLGTKELTVHEKNEIGKTIEAIAKADILHIRDDIMYIEDITREMSILQPAFVVIDFIQRIKTHRCFNSRREEIDYISSEIKNSAMVYNCHIMTLSQLARKSEGHNPSMDDLKESGGLTQDNDYILLLYRPNVKDKKKPSTEAYLTIDKNKYGETGRKEMNFNGGMQRFTEVQKV